jgi:hypothetical protein
LRASPDERLAMSNPMFSYAGAHDSVADAERAG